MSSKHRVPSPDALSPIELGRRGSEHSVLHAVDDVDAAMTTGAAHAAQVGRAGQAAQAVDDSGGVALRSEPALLDVAVLPDHSRIALAIGRAVDVVVSLLMIGVGLLPCLLIALLVKTTSRGPVFFNQERVGRGGRTFRLYKFRTMRDGTHADLLADEKLRHEYEDNDFKLPPDDPRITRVGRLLRKTSLDELPQLLHVVRGDMSIVGIRPLLPQELKLRPVYDQALYQMLRPGLTGLWQVEGRSSVGKTDRLALDRRYVEEWSVLSDLWIMIRTPLAVLRVHHAH